MSKNRSNLTIAEVEELHRLLEKFDNSEWLHFPESLAIGLVENALNGLTHSPEEIEELFTDPVTGENHIRDRHRLRLDVGLAPEQPDAKPASP